MTVAGRAAAGALGALLAVACASSGRRPPPPPDPALRIWLPGVVHWDAGGERALRFAIENGTNRTVSVPEPDPAGARVAIFGDVAETPLCSVEPGADGAPAPGTPVALAPGEQVIVEVNLGAECAALPPGEYRFEVAYRVPASEGQAAVTLPARYGKVFVEGRGRAAARRPPTVQDR
jgi:hypothetical protein